MLVCETHRVQVPPEDGLGGESRSMVQCTTLSTKANQAGGLDTLRLLQRASVQEWFLVNVRVNVRCSTQC